MRGREGTGGNGRREAAEEKEEEEEEGGSRTKNKTPTRQRGEKGSTTVNEDIVPWPEFLDYPGSALFDLSLRLLDVIIHKGLLSDPPHLIDMLNVIDHVRFNGFRRSLLQKNV